MLVIAIRKGEPKGSLVMAAGQRNRLRSRVRENAGMRQTRVLTNAATGMFPSAG